MKPKHTLFISLMALALMNACNDDAGNSSNKPGPDCEADGTCNTDCEADGTCNTDCKADGTCKADCDPACKSEEVCINKTCVPKECAKCGPNEQCVDKKCVDKSKVCNPPCVGDQKCIDNKCQVLNCDNPCGGECCESDQVCDQVTNTCGNVCLDGSAECYYNCCSDKQQCNKDFGCVEVCGEGKTECLIESTHVGICCDQGLLCSQEAGGCVIDCDPEKLCGETCCDSTKECNHSTNECQIICTDSQTRCGADGNLCCNNDTQVCLYQKCINKGKTCFSHMDCEINEFCEPTYATCVDQTLDPSVCIVKPRAGKFEPIRQFHWPSCLPGGKPSHLPSYISVLDTPLVANLTDDNRDGVVNLNDIPDIVFVAYNHEEGTNTHNLGVLRVISGDDGHEIASSDAIYWSYSVSHALADIDNDGLTDIVISTNFEKTSDHKDALQVLDVVPDSSSPTGFKLSTKYELVITDPVADRLNQQRDEDHAVADLDSDGIPEIITAYGVAHVKDGRLQWIDGCKKKRLQDAFPADLDGDGKMELVSRDTIYDNKCNALVTIGERLRFGIADMMPDGPDSAATGELKPEIALVNRNEPREFEFLKIYKKDNKWSVQSKWKHPIPIPRNCKEPPMNCSSGGGIPVIADFNGDGKPDVGVAARHYYIVYSNDGTSEGGKVLWADGHIQDISSGGTGSSVFDFEGDGKAEVVYADETKLRVYSGQGSNVDKDGDGFNDPEILLEVDNGSETASEYPVIVDVDNDGSTEIVFASDRGETTGITVFEDPKGQWMRTRRIWNQVIYYVTNINEDGSVPKVQESNWLNPSLNNYRQNVQPIGMFNAPNLIANGLKAEMNTCPIITLTATIANAGALGVRAGVSVSFWVKNADGKGNPGYIGTANAEKVLSPKATSDAKLQWDGTVTVGGAKLRATFPAQVYYVIDEKTDVKPDGEFIECREDDNTSEAVSVIECPSA